MEEDELDDSNLVQILTQIEQENKQVIQSSQSTATNNTIDVPKVSNIQKSQVPPPFPSGMYFINSPVIIYYNINGQNN